MKRWKLWVAEPERFTRAGRDLLERTFDVELASPGKPELVHALQTADAIWMHLGHRIDAGTLKRAAEGSVRCRVIAVPATGTDHIDRDATREHGVRVLSLRGETEFLRDVRATAEHTIGLLLALVRHVPSAAAAVESGSFERGPFQGRELYGKTLGLVGLGRLGRIVARYAKALDMTVLGFDPYVAGVPDVEGVSTLDELAARSDVVSVHASLTEETRGLLSDAFFHRMKRGAWFVNTARGPIIDEDALVAALDEGKLAGAALDVVAGEPNPTPATSAVLRALPRLSGRLLVTPHIGGNTVESIEKAEVFLAEKVCAAFAATV